MTPSILACLIGLLLTASLANGQQFLDNRETCAHRVLNCDPSVDHFETKVSMKHSSSVTRLDYENTHVLLEQSWPTRGPWMQNTTQKVVLVRCGCPVPELSDDWSAANVIHIPVSTVMVQMPNTLSKIYMMGQRSKVAAIESNRYISDATPEVATDIRDGIVRRLDLSPNGVPSTRITLSFTSGVFADATSGFRLQLVRGAEDDDADPMVVVGETDCIFPTLAGTPQQEPIETVLDKAFNSVPGWVDAGNVWVLTTGEASAEPSTSLSYAMYFDNQLSMNLNLRGDASTCGSSDLAFKIDRDSAPSNRPIYHRLHDLPGGFPDVLITEPRSLGPLADDPTVSARQFLDSDPGEDNPLGRAELMKLVALLTGSVETGNALFDSIEARYETAKAVAATASYRPTVMVGKPGTWNEAARNSWMITVGSTYVGELLRDANVEYRNSDDSVNKAICGSGCGACPSGQSDTRCSVGIDDYLDLFRSSDYWIVAGIGANCWSASCNFAISADQLLGENTEVYSQFMPMQCGTLIGLDQSLQDGTGGNQYWELGRLRPDLILMDLVTLMHPELGIKDTTTTTFFRLLEPLTDSSGVVPACPRTDLPATPAAGTVHATAFFVVGKESDPPSDRIGDYRFAVLESLYPDAQPAIAEALGVDASDLTVSLSNNAEDPPQAFGEDVRLAVTVRVDGCTDHSCGATAGRALEGLGPDDLKEALGLPWIDVRFDASRPVRLRDPAGDVIPLGALAVITGDTTAGGGASVATDGDSDDATSGGETIPASAASEERPSGDDGDGIGAGVVVGIVIGVLAAVGIAVAVTYNTAYAKGLAASSKSAEQTKQQEGPQLVDAEALS